MRIFFAAKSEMMGMTTVFNASGVDKENFVKYTEENPATYRVPLLFYSISLSRWIIISLLFGLTPKT